MFLTIKIFYTSKKNINIIIFNIFKKLILENKFFFI